MLRLLALLALIAAPLVASAEEEFFLATEGPSFNGTWQIRSFTISTEGSDSWGEPYNGSDVIDLAEAEDGTLTGTMVLHGSTFPITGKVDYGKDRVTVTWVGEHDNDGVTVRRSFHAYLLPFYARADEQVDMLAGTEGISVVGDGFGASSSFVAVRTSY